MVQAPERPPISLVSISLQSVPKNLRVNVISAFQDTWNFLYETDLTIFQIVLLLSWFVPSGSSFIAITFSHQCKSLSESGKRHCVHFLKMVLVWCLQTPDISPQFLYSVIVLILKGWESDGLTQGNYRQPGLQTAPSKC